MGNLNFGDLQGYEAYEGDGAAAVLPFDGMVQVKITSIVAGKAKSSGDDKVKITMNVHGEELDGQPVTGVLYKDIPYSGTFKSGPNQGKPKAVLFGDFLTSAGWSQDEIRELAAKGTSVDINSVIEKTMSGECTAFVIQARQTLDNGREISDVKRFITPTRYAKATAGGTARNFHQRSQRQPAAVAPTSAPASNSAGNLLDSVESAL